MLRLAPVARPDTGDCRAGFNFRRGCLQQCLQDISILLARSQFGDMPPLRSHSIYGVRPYRAPGRKRGLVGMTGVSRASETARHACIPDNPTPRLIALSHSRSGNIRSLDRFMSLFMPFRLRGSGSNCRRFFCRQVRLLLRDQPSPHRD